MTVTSLSTERRHAYNENVKKPGFLECSISFPVGIYIKNVFNQIFYDSFWYAAARQITSVAEENLPTAEISKMQKSDFCKILRIRVGNLDFHLAMQNYKENMYLLVNKQAGQTNKKLESRQTSPLFFSRMFIHKSEMLIRWHCGKYTESINNKVGILVRGVNNTLLCAYMESRRKQGVRHVVVERNEDSFSCKWVIM